MGSFVRSTSGYWIIRFTWTEKVVPFAKGQRLKANTEYKNPNDELESDNERNPRLPTQHDILAERRLDANAKVWVEVEFF